MNDPWDEITEDVDVPVETPVCPVCLGVCVGGGYYVGDIGLGGIPMVGWRCGYTGGDAE